MIGYLMWALILAAALVVEGLGLTLRGERWPTISDVFRSVTRSPVGRWLFFAMWLWLGWHFFIRGWDFFLRGAGPSTHRGSGGHKSVSATLTQVVGPLLLVLGLLGGIGAASRRAGAEAAKDTRRASGSTTLLRYAVITLAGGFAIFVGFMGFYELVAGRRAAPGVLGSSAAGGAFLCFVIALPLFAGLTIVRDRRHAPE